MTPLVTVHGTWGRGSAWHRFGSPLVTALATRDFTVFGFLWSGYCGGVPSPIIVPPSTDEMKGNLELWRSEGEKLRFYCALLGLKRPRVLSHSHGLQVVTFAAVAGQAFETVLSISGPVREDMAWWRQKARPNIGRWVQVTDPTGADRTILEGELFDGEVGWHFELPEADQNIEAHGVGHSGLLHQFDELEWEELGLWAALGVKSQA